MKFRISEEKFPLLFYFFKSILFIKKISFIAFILNIQFEDLTNVCTHVTHQKQGMKVWKHLYHPPEFLVSLYSQLHPDLWQPVTGFCC